MIGRNKRKKVLRNTWEGKSSAGGMEVSSRKAKQMGRARAAEVREWEAKSGPVQVRKMTPNEVDEHTTREQHK